MSWLTRKLTEMGGWIPATETLVYSAAETSPNWGTVTITGDYTTKFAKNRKIRFTQTTVKHGIIMRSAYAGGTTTLKIFMGADTLADAAISDVYYSTEAFPDGFPAMSTWILQTIDTTKREQASPTISVWYYVGAVNIVVPPGDWIIRATGDCYSSRAAAGETSIFLALSTAEDANTVDALTLFAWEGNDTKSRLTFKLSALQTLDAETIYKVIMKTGASGQATVTFGSVFDTVLEAVPACFRY